MARAVSSKKLAVRKDVDGQELPLPKSGKNPGGVTKESQAYDISCHGANMVIIDTPGVGDATKGTPALISDISKYLKDESESPSGSALKIHGIIVTCTSPFRLGTAAQIVQAIIKEGMVEDLNGLSPWSRIIVCGTKRDKCDDDNGADDDDDEGEGGELQNFTEKTVPLFFQDTGVTPDDWQITTTSTKEDGGMDDLMDCMQRMVEETSQHSATWDPDFEENGGSERMAEGLSNVTSGNVELLRLEIDMHMALKKVLAAKAKRDHGNNRFKDMTATGVEMAANSVREGVIAGIGKDSIKTYTDQQKATGLGSGFMRSAAGTTVSLSNGNEKAVGEAMLKFAEKHEGSATIASTSGVIKKSLGRQVGLLQGLGAGTHSAHSYVGQGGEILADQCEATKGYKGIIGGVSQLISAGIHGFCIGGFSSSLSAMATSGVSLAAQKSSTILGAQVGGSGGGESEVQAAEEEFEEAKAKYEEAISRASENQNV